MAHPQLSSRLRSRLFTWTAYTVLRAGPAGHRAVVAGTPDEEGNSVEVVRALAERMPVTWLVSDRPEHVRWLLEGCQGCERVRLVRKSSLRGFAAYARARYVFFTHGLYGSPQPPGRRMVVNLWHGDGPKRRKGLADIRSTVTVAGTRAWGARRAEHFKVGPDGVLVTGNPRIDQLGRPVDDAVLQALGLDPRRPLVLWLPTYRTTDSVGRRLTGTLNWSDGDELSRRDQVRRLLETVNGLTRDLAVELVVKPHPLDSDGYAEAGLKVLTSSDLRVSRVSLYQLLGRTAGLITDYSSVWTDYLALDRPVGFFCPDLEEYVSSRGLNVPDYRVVAPGPFLASAADFERFFVACTGGPDPWQELRRSATESLGVETRLGATERLLERLGLDGTARPSVERQVTRTST